MGEPLLIPTPTIIPTTTITQSMPPNPNPNSAAASNPNPNPNQTPLRCPRCDSSNTKFCYYNNYSLAQPRHFCKSCKRYWTRGGTLRNVPVGGGCRKNKRSKKQQLPSINSASTATTKLDHTPNWLSNSLSHIFHNNSSYPALDHAGNLGFGSIVPAGTTGMNSTGLDLQSLGFLNQSNQFPNLQQSGVLDDQYPIFGSSFFSSFKLSNFEELNSVSGAGEITKEAKSLLQKERSKVLQWQLPCDNNFMGPIGSSDGNVPVLNNGLPVFSNGGSGLSDPVSYGSSVAPLF